MVVICIFPKVNIIGFGSSTGIRLEDFILLICVVGIMVSSRKRIANRGFLAIQKFRKCFYVYFFFAIISTFLGIIYGYTSPITSVLYLIRKFEYFTLIYIGYVYSKYYVKKADKYIKALVVIHLVFCILQYFGLMGSFNRGEAISTLTQGRVSSTFNGAYELSAFLLILLPYFLYSIFFVKKRVLSNLVYVAIITFCILLSQSRTSLFVEAIVILVVMINSRFLQTKKGVFKIAIPVLLIGIPFVYLVGGSVDFSRYANIGLKKTIYIFQYCWENRNFESYVRTRDWYGNANLTIYQMSSMGYDGSMYARVSHWMQLVDGWLRHPIFGVGVSVAGGSADGNYLKILTETGIVGLLSWIVLLKNMFKALKKNKSFLYYSLLSIAIGAILIDLFDASKVMMLYWFVFGVLMNQYNQENARR